MDGTTAKGTNGLMIDGIYHCPRMILDTVIMYEEMKLHLYHKLAEDPPASPIAKRITQISELHKAVLEKMKMLRPHFPPRTGTMPLEQAGSAKEKSIHYTT